MAEKRWAARTAAVAASAAVAWWTAGCAREIAPPFAGPVFLITIEALPAAATGLGGSPSSSATSALDAFAARASWAGAALAPSSWEAPSAATLLTGLLPDQHGTTEFAHAVLSADTDTLASALHRVGYSTAAFSNSTSLRGASWFRGFDTVWPIGQLDAALEELERTGAEHPGAEGRDRRFAWFHLGRAQPPWRNENGAPDGLPPKVDWQDLPMVDARLLPALRQRHHAAAAAADRQLRAILDLLGRTGQLERSVVVVTATHGVALEEQAPRGYGTGLARAQIEVPLVVHLPDGPALAGRTPRAPLPSLGGVAPFLAELTGARLPPAVAAPLDRASSGGRSELALPGGRLLLTEVTAEAGPFPQVGSVSQAGPFLQVIVECPAEGRCAPPFATRWAAASPVTFPVMLDPSANGFPDPRLRRHRTGPEDWRLADAEAAWLAPAEH